MVWFVRDADPDPRPIPLRNTEEAERRDEAARLHEGWHALARQQAQAVSARENDAPDCDDQPIASQ